MERSKEAGYEQAHRDRAVQEDYEHDGYKARGKLPEPTICPGCNAVFHKGRWTWRRPKGSPSRDFVLPVIDPRQISRGVPDAQRAVYQAHQEEILNLIRNEGEKAKAEHPLSRVMASEKRNHDLVITTTDTHLPQRIGSALKHAHGGELDLKYAKDEYLVRADLEKMNIFGGRQWKRGNARRIPPPVT